VELDELDAEDEEEDDWSDDEPDPDADPEMLRAAQESLRPPGDA